MNYPSELVAGTVVRRYKRYLIDVLLADGQQVTAHCPNPGRMTSCLQVGAPCRLLYGPSPKRKLDWTLEQVQIGDTWIGVHPGRANDVVAQGIAAGVVPQLRGVSDVRREVKAGDSRVDFCMLRDGRTVWVEVKQVTLRDEHGLAAFPDAVTARGLKHVRELAALVVAGDEALLLFAVARNDVSAVRSAHEVDPAYAAGLAVAMAQGLKVAAHTIDVRADSLTLGGAVPLQLP